MALKRGIEKAVASAVESIAKQARDVEGRDEIAHVAALSAADRTVGETIAEAFDKVAREHRIEPGASRPQVHEHDRLRGHVVQVQQQLGELVTDRNRSGQTHAAHSDLRVGMTLGRTGGRGAARSTDCHDRYQADRTDPSSHRFVIREGRRSEARAHDSAKAGRSVSDFQSGVRRLDPSRRLNIAHCSSSVTDGLRPGCGLSPAHRRRGNAALGL
jgi:hypothetical protein